MILAKKYYNPVIWGIMIVYIPYYLVFGGLKAYYIDAKELILRELNW